MPHIKSAAGSSQELHATGRADGLRLVILKSGVPASVKLEVVWAAVCRVCLTNRGVEMEVEWLVGLAS